MFYFDSTKKYITVKEFFMPNIIETRRIAETMFINLVEDTYIDKKGIRRKWVKAERVNNTNAVMIVATVNRNGSKYLVVTKEYRVPLKDYEWGTPAGLIDPGENPAQAATRELKEETGLDTSRILEVTPLVYNSPGLTSEGIHLVYLEANGEISQKHTGDSEDISTFVMQREGIATLLSDKSKLFGAKAWLIFKQFTKYGEVL
jgi:ADP-ribose pyrophosphatase